MNRTIACIILVITSHAGAEEPQSPVNDKVVESSDVRGAGVGRRQLPQGAKLLPIPNEVSEISEELRRIRSLDVEQGRNHTRNALPKALDEAQRERLAIAIRRSGASVYLKRGFGGEPVLMLRYNQARFSNSFRDWPEAIELLQRFSDPDHTPDDRDVYFLREATRALEMLGLRYDDSLRLVDDMRGETELREKAPSMNPHADATSSEQPDTQAGTRKQQATATDNDRALKSSGDPSVIDGIRLLPIQYMYDHSAELNEFSTTLEEVKTLTVEQLDSGRHWRLPLPDDFDQDRRIRLANAIFRSHANFFVERRFAGQPTLVVCYNSASMEAWGRHLPKVIELLQRFGDRDHKPDLRDVYDQREATQALELLRFRYDENLRLVSAERAAEKFSGDALSTPSQKPAKPVTQADDREQQSSTLPNLNENLSRDISRPLDPAATKGGGVEDALQASDESVRDSMSAIQELKRGYISAETQAAEFAVQVRGGLDPERADIGVGKEQREQLERLVEKAFELRLSLQRKQLADAEERLTATRKRLDRREDSAKSIIERRVDALLFSIDESMLKSSTNSPSQDQRPAITSQDTIAPQAAEHPELQRFKRYFGLELARDADGQIVFYRRSKIDGDESPVNELRQLVQLKFLLVDLENPGERAGSQTRQINDVEDVAKFLREDSPKLASKLVVYSITANRESESKGRTYFDLIPGPQTILDSKMREELSKTQTVLTNYLQQTRKRLGQIEKSKFDERQNQALRDTLPTEIVKLEVELGKSEIQWRHLQELQRSEPSQRLAEVLEKLESPSIKQAESAVLDRERVQLQGKLSAQIRAIISSDVSLSGAKVGTAIAGALKKVEVLSTRIDMLESQLTSADLQYQQAKDDRSEASRLRAEISRIEEFSEFVATRLSSAGNDASTIDDASCRVGISCDRAMNIHYIDRPVTPVKRSDDGKERRLDAKVVRFVTPMSGPFNLRLSITDGTKEKASAPVLNVNVAIDFFETETLRQEGMEFRISDQDLDFLEAYDRVTIALIQNPAGNIESRRIRERLDSPSSLLASADDPAKTMLAVVSIRNLNEDLRFLKLAGTWTPVADSIPHIDQELLASNDGADIHFSVDKLLWTSLPMEAKANDILKFYSEQYADPELTPVVTGTVRPRTDESAAAEVQKEFFVVFRKSGGDTILVIGVVLGSRPTIKLAGDGTLMQLTWNGSDGFPSPLAQDSEWSVPISYRPIETEL